MKRRLSGPHRGFTLIELLVVISIIGMLSSVVMASVQSARDKGRIAGGIRFERHTKDAFGDKILAEYSFDSSTECPNGSATPSGNLISVPNNWGTSGLNLTAFNPSAVQCSVMLSADTPTGKGSSFNFAKISGTTRKYYLLISSPATNVNTGISFSKFSIGFWIKASPLLTQTKSISILTSGSNPLDVTLVINLTSPTPFIGNGTSPSSFSNFVNLPPSVIVDNKWHYVFISINTNTTSVFVDGKVSFGGTPATGLGLQTTSSIENIEFNEFGTAGGDDTAATLLIDNLVLIGDAP